MPSNSTDVNFLPDDVVSSRKHVSQVKNLNQVALGAMMVCLLLGGALFGYNLYTKSKVNSLKTKITTEEGKIQELNEFAVSGYKLGLRLGSIKQILDTRPYYAKVFEEIYKKVPSGISVDSMQITDKGGFTISGHATPNYIPIANFQDNLKNSESGYFSAIRLRSASLDKTTGEITYTIDFAVDLTKTYEPIQ